jgi:hypothetical protein
MKIFGGILLLFLLTACQVVKVPEPTGGSKADGTVDMSYSMGEFEVPVIDMEQARIKAKKRCVSWGYKDAEIFGGQKSQCNAYTLGGGCAVVSKNNE